jgi:CheY-like chemotaxis protein
VLVVEDDERDQEQLVRALTAAGYSVETAATGSQAIARCRERTFDAISLDLLLPDGNGLEVLQAIRAEGTNRDVPIIVVTVVTEHGAMAGFAVHDVFSKPLDEEAMLRSLLRAGVSPEQPGTVLVIDDDPGSAKILSAALSLLQLHATCVPRAVEGLRIAAQSPPRAVVLDLLMPGMDGFEFLEQFRRLPSCAGVPVIVWSSKDLSALEHARLAGSTLTVLQKGRDVGAAVVDAIRAALTMTRANRG